MRDYLGALAPLSGKFNWLKRSAEKSEFKKPHGQPLLGCHSANTLAEAKHVIHIRGRRRRRLHIVGVVVGVSLASRAASQVGAGLGCSCNFHNHGNDISADWFSADWFSAGLSGITSRGLCQRIE